MRTFDVVHRSSALVARSAVAGLALLSLDERIRTVGRKLGLTLLPDDVR
ncbi:MAG: hypothetical protein AB7N65_27505 [Vicinamibacterales bacterium]